jgi:hypothetical protein
MPNLPPGPYELAFGCAGYGTQFFRSQPSQATLSLIAVNAGVTTRVGARLSRAGAIAGTVRSSRGKPVNSVCVEVTPAGNKSKFSYAGLAFTNKKGHYRLGGLEPGRYLVVFNSCLSSGRFGAQWYSGQPSESAATPVSVRRGRTDQGIDAALTAGGSITGQVTTPSGKPANGLCVFAVSTAAQVTGFAQTGKRGRYRIKGLSSGRWSLEFSTCFSNQPRLGSLTRSGIHVTAPHTVTGVNVRMPVGGSISGTVVSRAGATPISGTCVLFVPVKSSDGVGLAVTDGRGRYTASGLDAGRYHAYIADTLCLGPNDTNVPFAPQWYPDQATRATARTVRLSAGGAVTRINAALSLFGAVTGTVQTRAHAAVAGECVTAIPFRTPPDLLTGLPAQPEVAITGRGGSYTLIQLTPGRYKIEFSSGCGGRHFATRWWDNAGSARAAEVITVKFATITGINATLRR